MSNFGRGRRYSPIPDPYASDSSNAPSPLMKYLRSADPAASSEVFLPVQMEEDVIVMDGIPMSKFNRGGDEVRVRSSGTSFDSGIGGLTGGRSNSTSAPRGRVSQSEIRKNKIKMCRAWEISGTCKFGSECQFAHSKEELDLNHRFSVKTIKPEIFNSDTSTKGWSPSSYSTKHPLNRAAEPFTSPSLQTRMAVPTTPIQVNQLSETTVIKSMIPNKSYTSLDGSNSLSSHTKYPFNNAAEPFLPSLQTQTAFPTTPIQVTQPSERTVISSVIPSTQDDWIPQDDGIDFPVPSIDNPTREDVIAYMLKLQNGTRLKKRLPVFEEICPQ